jgi:hypothetical protein
VNIAAVANGATSGGDHRDEALRRHWSCVDWDGGDVERKKTLT